MIKLLIAVAMGPIVLIAPVYAESLPDSHPQHLSLGVAARRTLAKNPELQAFSYELRASEGRKLQAGLRPNPELSFVPENTVGTEFFRQQIQNTLEISQLLELGEKRERRIEVAHREGEKALTAYELKRNEILSALNLQFVSVIAEQEQLRLAKRAKSLASQMLQLIRKRSAVGGAAGYEEPKSRILAAQAEISEEHSEHELLSCRKKLGAFWGAEQVEDSIVGNLYHRSPLPELSVILTQLESSPRIAQLNSEERLRKALVDLEDARSTPDLTLGLGWRYGRSIDEQAAVASLSIPLQIFDRNQGSIAAAKAKFEQVGAEKSAATFQLRTVAFELFQELKHADTELSLLDREIVPQAEKVSSLVTEGYQLGRYSFTELRDAQQDLLSTSAAKIAAATRYHTLFIQLQNLLGNPSYDALH